MDQSGRSGSRVHKLGEETSSLIRKSEIIARVYDVIRELVENSVDASASSIRIQLENYGLAKIEVVDTGIGITPSEFHLATGGGATSKLTNDNILSCQEHYGFRGEALSAICALGDVIISTKPKTVPTGTRYVLDERGGVKESKKVASGNGCTVTVRNIFKRMPVRKLYLSNRKNGNAELSDIEDFLNSVSLANPQIHINFTHNGELLYNKPSVNSVEQAIVTVFGVEVAKKLGSCEELLNIDEEENLPPTMVEPKRRSLKLHLPSLPVDYKITGKAYSNKYTMIFVNKKRVHIKEFEKLIRAYFLRAVSRDAFTHGELTKYPVAVLLIELPPEEADFNREIDKSRVFLVHRELIRIALERLLKTFYNLDMSEKDITLDTSLSTTVSSGEGSHMNESILNASNGKSEERHKVISSFLEGVSPVKKDQNAAQNVKKKEFVANFDMDFGELMNSLDQTSQSPPISTQKQPGKEFKANFDMSFDLENLDILELEPDPLPNRPREEFQAPAVPGPSNQTSNDSNNNKGQGMPQIGFPQGFSLQNPENKNETALDAYERYQRAKGSLGGGILPLTPSPGLGQVSKRVRRASDGVQNNSIGAGEPKRTRHDSSHSFFSNLNTSNSTPNLNFNANSALVSRSLTPVPSPRFSRPPPPRPIYQSSSYSALNRSSGFSGSSATPKPKPKVGLFNRSMDADPRQVTLDSLKNWRYSPRNSQSTSRYTANRSSSSHQIFPSIVPASLLFQPSPDRFNINVLVQAHSPRPILSPTVPDVPTPPEPLQLINQNRNPPSQSQQNKPPKAIKVQVIGAISPPEGHQSSFQLFAIKIGPTLGAFCPSKYLNQHPNTKIYISSTGDIPPELSVEDVDSLLNKIFESFNSKLPNQSQQRQEDAYELLSESFKPLYKLAEFDSQSEP